MSEHNRAPWRVKPVRGQAPYIVDADGLTIGMAMHWLGSENDPLPNANLIAAAPDLLAACETASETIVMLVAEVGKTGGLSEETVMKATKVVSRCEVVIARAKGESDYGN